MLNNDDETVESLESKTPSLLSSPANRSLTKVEEKPVRSGSSSDGSSPTHLRKRLQHLPSPHEATLLASRVSNIGRRLSRKQDLFFYSKTNRIEEHVEREEREAQETLFTKKFSSETKAKDARARRRAKIRLENANQTMVVSKPADVNASELKNNSNNEATSNSGRSLIIENNSDGQPVQSPPLVETSKSCPQRCSPWSGRTPTNLSPFRSELDDANNDSVRSQLNLSSIRLFCSASCENSPKNKVALQPLSPISLTNIRPTKFGGYRPQAGVILQNLSSGSEADSTREVASARVGSAKRIERLIPTTRINVSSGASDATPASSNRSEQQFNDRLTPVPLPSGRSLASHGHVDSSSRKEAFESATVSPTQMNFLDNKLQTSDLVFERSFRSDYQNLNDRLTSPLSSLRTMPCESNSYRITSSPRSIKDNRSASENAFTKNVNESMFLSARGETHGRNRQPFDTSLRLFEQIYHDASSNILNTETFASSQLTATNLEGNDHTVALNESVVDSSRSMGQFNEYRTTPSTATSLQSPENIFRCSIFENPAEDKPEHPSSNTDLHDFKQIRSRRSMNYDEHKDNAFATSARTTYRETKNAIFSPQFRSSISEGNNAASPSKELFVNKFIENRKDDIFLQELYANQNPNDRGNERQFANIPILALNSQEVSCSSSPANKTCSERHLDADALITALSNVSLKQPTTNNLTNTAVSKTISRPESSENNLNADKSLRTSFRSDENRGASNEFRVSYSSSVNMRSKIPVKVPKIGSKSNTSRSIEFEEQTVKLDKSPIDSNRQSFRNDDSSPKEYQFTFGRNDQVFRSPEDLFCARNYVSENFKAKEQEADLEESPIDSNGQTFPCDRSVSGYQVDSEKSDQIDSEKSDQLDSEKSDQVTRLREKLPFVKNCMIENFERSTSSTSCSSVNATSTERNERFDSRFTTSKAQNRGESENSERIRSKECLTPLQIQTSDENRPESKEESQKHTYRVDFNNDEKSFESMVNQPEINETFWPSKEHAKVDDKTDSVASESDLEDNYSLHRYRKQETLSTEEVEEPDNFSSRIESNEPSAHPVRSPRLDNYRTKYLNTYEGEICQKVNEKKKIKLFENQIGDGGGQEMFLHESTKLGPEATSLDSSSEDDEFGKNKKPNTHDKLRFSLERLAAEQFRRNICTEQTKTIQSDTVTFFADKLYEAPQFSPVHSSSMSRLCRAYERTRESPRIKKKSQDRFPFTISEKTSVSSMKFKVPGRLAESLDENKKSPERSYKLGTHPSITRLGGSGFEDTPADIIGYVTRSEQADRQIKSFGMKVFVQKFSARLKRSKNRDQTKVDPKKTNVIYENRAYTEEYESSDSCSESSLLTELKIYENMGRKRQSSDSPDEKSSIISDKKSPKSSKDTPETSKRSCRRYDRDDLWVQAFKNPDSGRVRRNEFVETEKDEEEEERRSTNDPYSMFFVKSTRGTQGTSAVAAFLPKETEKQTVSVERRRNRVKFRGSSFAVVPKRSDENVHKRSVESRNIENVRRNRKVGKGCLCFRFYRMIVPVSFGSRNNSSSIKKKFRFPLQRKKG